MSASVFKSMAACAAFVVVLISPPGAQAALLQNAGFQDATLSPWVEGGSPRFVARGGSREQGNTVAIVELRQTGEVGSLRQTFAITAAGTYAWAFDWAVGEHFCRCSEPIRAAVLFDNVQVFTETTQSTDFFAGDFILDLDRHSSGTVFLGVGNHEITFAFRSLFDPGFGRSPYVAFDGIALQAQSLVSVDPTPQPAPVPVPGSLALALAGLGLFRMASRRGRV